ncbi:hypothetical protein [Cyclobacterium jeungdonense]|uniref:Uncharacterized protein n=1 Tax=Cyclobacterium jeungdonense TaxID=708087 RepID=A0ABT8C8G5_9BACT|nr:hypothetical protein [Cyclobacterium jeungdonense]MDN3689079.1 hypothetical protein [Cyclobacterium jeungdonense]
MENQKFETTALIELFGHTRMAGTVSEQTIGSATFIRVDVPETKSNASFTRFLHPNSIYAINPITVEVMQHLADDMQVKPVNAWDIREIVRKEKAMLGMGEEEEEGFD